MKHNGDYYFTDHSVHGPQGRLCNVTHQSQVMHGGERVDRHEVDHAPTHHELLHLSHSQLDNVKVQKAYWLYEQRWVYQHSYMVLEAELSPYEYEHRADLGIPEGQKVKYYVTEKNDLGIIWNVFYDF